MFTKLALFLSFACAVSYAHGNRNTLSKCNSQLSLDLLKKLYDDKENLFFSPASISTAMAMVMAGTAGDTTNEVLNSLFGGLKESRVHHAHRKLMKTIKSSSDIYDISMANRIYGKEGFTIKPSFLQKLKKNYRTEFLQKDLASENTRVEINQWVEKVTKDRIKNLIKKGVLTDNTVMVLINAIYFKGNWQSPFQVDQTRDKSFYVKPGTDAMVPMMHQTTKADYFQNDEVQVLGLPYENKTMSMLIVLPQERYGLSDLVKSLTGPSLLDMVSKMRSVSRIGVSIPRMKVEADFSLKKSLQQMGVKKLFNGGDFTKISDKHLEVSDVIHKAFVKVDEKGSEAAAATGVVVGRTSLGQPKKFTADHPFLFFIWHHKANMALFSGALVDPSRT